MIGRQKGDRMGTSMRARDTTGHRIDSTAGAGVQLDDAWDLARRHCAWRNRAVAEVLLHLRALRVAGLVDPGGRSIHALAAVPVAGIARIAVPSHVEHMLAELTLGDLERRRIRRTCFTSRLAHRLPCRLMIGDDLLTDLIRPSGPEQAVARAHFGGLFGLMDAVPTMFDEADSQLEQLGFADAFIAACAVALSDGDVAAGDRDASLAGAWDTWVRRAVAAAESGAARHRRQLDEREFAHRLYHHTKSELFQLYADLTHEQRAEGPRASALSDTVAVWSVPA